MNVIFISPNFPDSYRNFCMRLSEGGATVLGIGDAPYDSLHPDLKSALTEYYRVGSLANYFEMYRAVAFLCFRYGKIDWLESNNENWLETDARLRTDFNITTGPQNSDMLRFKSKAEQKKYYARAGVPTARQVKIGPREAADAFIARTGYPVFVKPEVGVGAAASYKIPDASALDSFFATKPDVPYVIEEFITGDIWSYDAIVNSRGKPLFESSSHFPPSIADIAANGWDCPYEVVKSVPEQLRERGRACLKAFKVRSRFVHFEFFRLDCDRPGLGVKGDFVGLETNMRPAGGNTPDMMDYAHATDVYRIWADMVLHDARLLPENPEDDHFCAYYGRRDAVAYLHPHEEVMARYGSKMALQGRVPDALSDDLGNTMYIIHAADEREVAEFDAWMGAKK